MNIDSSYWINRLKSDNFILFQKIEDVIVHDEATAFLGLFEEMRKKGFKLISTMPSETYLFERTVSIGCK